MNIRGVSQGEGPEAGGEDGGGDWASGDRPRKREERAKSPFLILLALFHPDALALFPLLCPCARKGFFFFLSPPFFFGGKGFFSLKMLQCAARVANALGFGMLHGCFIS